MVLKDLQRRISANKLAMGFNTASDADDINREICFLVDDVEIERVPQNIESRHYTRGDNGRPISSV